MPAQVPTDSFDVAARPLEEAFFLQEDQLLIERLRSMKKMAETKESLAEVSGISDDAILSRLVELGVRPETLAALAAIPLVEVAWADGEVTPAERQVVLNHADAHGIRAGSVEYDLLERWLTHRPEPTLLEAWQAYVRGLCGGLSGEERQLLKDELLGGTQATAEADGGFLGLGRVSGKEKQMLDRLSATFHT
jgi:hypothetical protein